MKTHRITKAHPGYQPAYVANGFVGLRVGTNPFCGQTALLSGFTGSHERFGVEAYAPIPAVQYNITMDGSSLQKFPEGYQLIEQAYDFSCGELVTKFAFTNARGQVLKGTSLVYCSRSSPSAVIQETEVEVMQVCDLRFSTLLETNPLPIHCRLTVVPNVDCDGVLWIESRDRSTTAGVATYLQCEGEGEFEEFRRGWRGEVWGYEQEQLTKAYSIKAEPGKVYRYRMMTSYIPGTLHSEPHWQAVRMIKLAQWKGFEKLREENQKAWAKLWEGRIRIIGASEEWQDAVDASFFYLYSTIHPSSPQSMAPFGLSRRDEYKGHVFWDTESFMLTLPMFTDPASARAILDYRFDRFKAARYNAMINGFNGIQFPCQSGTTGDEVTRVSAGGAAGTGEVHFSIDVAMGFVAYAQVSGDPVFLRERAWPVVREIAEWILTRIEKTRRGFEILHVTGIDESIDNVNNDSFTNSICKLLLLHADRIGHQLGDMGNPAWKNVAERIFIPIHQEQQFIEQFEGCKIKDKMADVALMAIFPFGYHHTKQLAENTIRFLMDHGLEDNLVYPMLSGFLGVFPSRLGDRKRSRQFFDQGNLPFFVEPYWLSTEWSPNSPFHSKADKPVTTFITGRGSLLTGLMMGLTRLNIWKDTVDDWLEGPIVMPEGWDGVVLEKVYIHGRPARITAMHGMPKAQLEWLDQYDKKPSMID